MEIKNIKSLAIFCGANLGKIFNHPDYPDHPTIAKQVGTFLAEKGITIVYGGASVGLMGVVADAALAAGGKVIGVMPTDMKWEELIHPGLTELIEVPNLSERKRIMSERSDAALALPGGYGTLDEIFEFVTWTQLRVHNKPCGLLNIGSFYEHLINFLEYSCCHGYISKKNRRLLIHGKNPIDLFIKLDQMCRSEESNLALA